MSYRMRAAEYKKCVTALAGAHPGLQDRILLNYTVQKSSTVKLNYFHLLNLMPLLVVPKLLQLANPHEC